MKPIIAIALTLALAACSTDGEPLDPNAGARGVVADGIAYRAGTAVLESFPVQLVTTLTLTNPGVAAERVTFPDGCVVLLRAYPAGADRAVWDQAGTVACTTALVEVELRAGATRDFTTRTDARAILGDSLPAGRYRLEAYARTAAGEVAVSAGTVDLAVPPTS